MSNRNHSESITCNHVQSSILPILYNQYTISSTFDHHSSTNHGSSKYSSVKKLKKKTHGNGILAFPHLFIFFWFHPIFPISLSASTAFHSSRPIVDVHGLLFGRLKILRRAFRQHAHAMFHVHRRELEPPGRSTESRWERRRREKREKQKGPIDKAAVFFSKDQLRNSMSHSGYLEVGYKQFFPIDIDI